MALNAELVAFVKESLAKGIPRGEVTQVLLRAGWPEEQVFGALNGFSDIDFPIPVPRPVPTVSARDAFMYVVIFTTLILSAYNFGSLVFDLINRMYPDPGERYGRDLLDEIRWSLSTLIVAAPVFVLTSSAMAKATKKDPTKRTSRVRRQLTYITLFIAACVLLGDVICLVYNFLGGGLAIRLILKVLTVAVIAGSVFGYYLVDLRAGEKQPET